MKRLHAETAVAETACGRTRAPGAGGEEMAMGLLVVDLIHSYPLRSMPDLIQNFTPLSHAYNCQYCSCLCSISVLLVRGAP